MSIPEYKKVLVINGSPKGERSGCLKLAQAFIDGLGVEAEVLHAVQLNIEWCVGCYHCWNQTPGHCVFHDDMEALLDKVTHAELVIWCMPLYCYGMPAVAKRIVDRFLPLSTAKQETDETGRTYHPNREQKSMRFMLISGCGFANIEHNYEALLTQFGMMFGEDFPRILCVEAPLLTIPQAAPLAEQYLALVREAGEAFSRENRIPDELQKKLGTPMYPPEQYRKDING